MRTITSEEAALLLQLELPALRNEHGITKRVIEAIPLVGGDYRPDPQAKTALELAWHIAAAEQRFLSGVAAGAFDLAPIHRPDTVKDSRDIANWFAASFDSNFPHLATLSGTQAAKILDFRGVFQLPAVFFLRFSLNHSIHHRGQLSTYLRAMGGKVPAIYGESYDSAEARKSAQA